jgi:3-oxoacyl-[acyl-carrier protein] reductase
MKVMVTGTSRGLGKAIAMRLHESGYSVVGCARTDADVPFEHVTGIDFRDPRTFDRLFPMLGECGGLVNNVGIAFDGLLATQSEKSIVDVLHVNLVNTLVLTKHYVRRRLNKGGSIVNISSIIGIRGYAGLVAYSASKAGLDGATRALAREIGPKNFRVNSVLPGYMRTDMSAALGEAQMSQVIRRTPLRRLASVDDISPVVEFLVGPHAQFITGQSIIVDGGITA